ncbi:MAG: thiol-disulfide oxidoreductase [Deltaproteobacteria bacterium]|nr:thiol-disulfide oxidoreductase [Deltaproteobacteria bacterium]
MNQSKLEKEGIPTVTVATTAFIDLAKASTAGTGVPEMSFVVVEHPIGGISKEQIEAKADAAFPEILKMALEWKPQPAKVATPKPAYPAERVNFTGTIEDVNKLMFENGWSLGLPIVPPTPRRVEAMLKGTTRSPDEIIWVVPPRNGALTVELLAVHAAMAGCKPEYMPLLITVMEAFREEAYDWLGAATTTGSEAPMVLVNGPIVKELGIAYETGCLAGGYHPNVSMGYTVNLIGAAVGGAVATKRIDRSVLGNRANIIAYFFGENEDANPWEPYHVEKGFQPTDNVITVMSGDFVTLQELHCKTGAEVLTTISSYLGGGALCFGGGPLVGPNSFKSHFLVLSPERAAILAQDGWTKDAIRKYIVEHAKTQYGATTPKWRGIPNDFGPLTPESLVPVFGKPEEIQIIVAGGPGTHSSYVRGGHGSIVTKLIKR